jgi:membrane-bound ClpP family serine protease
LKKIIGLTIVIAVVIGILVWIASLIFSFPYLGWNFFIGLGLSVILFFFNSSGGFFTKSSALEASSGDVRYTHGNHDLKPNVGIVFYGSVLYTSVCLIHMIILYVVD